MYTLLDTVSLDISSLLREELNLPFEVVLNLHYRLLHSCLARHKEVCGVDLYLVQAVESLTSFGVNTRNLFDFVVEEGDAVAMVADR